MRRSRSLPWWPWCALLLSLAGVARAAPAGASGDGVTFETITWAGGQVDVVTVDLRRARLDLFWRDARGARLGSLAAVRALVEQRGDRPVAITNAGIFAPSRPAGLHIEGGRRMQPLNLASTDGNFGMKPNGVFFITGEGAASSAAIVESSELARRGEAGIRLATQSGPLLVRAGAVHPKFSPHSKNALLRSGIGVANDKRVVLAISRGPITFHDFALLFRDRLGCRDALYLDGVISQLWAPALGLDDDGGDFMGMLAVSVRKR